MTALGRELMAPLTNVIGLSWGAWRFLVFLMKLRVEEERVRTDLY